MRLDEYQQLQQEAFEGLDGATRERDRIAHEQLRQTRLLEYRRAQREALAAATAERNQAAADHRHQQQQLTTDALTAHDASEHVATAMLDWVGATPAGPEQAAARACRQRLQQPGDLRNRLPAAIESTTPLAAVMSARAHSDARAEAGDRHRHGRPWETFTGFAPTTSDPPTRMTDRGIAHGQTGQRCWR